jgi:hypothetical protein
MRSFIKHAITVVLAIAAVSCQQQEENYVTVKNKLDQDRPDARILLQRDSLSESLSSFSDSALVIKDEEGKYISYQQDDLDGDGRWDALALLCDLKAGEEKKLYFREIDKSDAPEFTERASIWFGKRDSTTQTYNAVKSEVRPEDYERVMEPPYYYQFEGPGWENDKIGFRMYFDDRNAFDIWGKTTTDMVLDSVGLGEDYHALQPWGMDVLKVGNSLGAGAMAVIEGDSLYHLGATERAEFKEIADGPVRAVFDLIYEGWKVADKNYSIHQRISIWGGQQGFQNEVSLLTENSNTTMVAGFVTMDLEGDPDFGEDPQPFPYAAGWGQQSANKDNLGMAVAGMPGAFEGYGERAENSGGVEQSAFLTFDLASNQPVQYVFVTGWEEASPDFGKKSGFVDALRDEGQRLNQPVEVIFQ